MAKVVAEPRGGDAGPGAAGGDPSVTFPTIAELLAEGALSGPAPETSPLTVLVEGAKDLESLRRLVPEGSLFVEVSADEATVGAPEQSPARVGSRDALLDLLREGDRDLLLVSTPSLLTAAVLDDLRSTLAEDSACASASVTDAVVVHVRGIPPPGVAAPRTGVVLVRRDHLLLALDEAPLVGRADAVSVPADAGLVADVLACIDRPGFLHRVVGTEREVDPLSPSRDARRSRTHRSAGIVVDGRCFALPVSGTQVQILGLVGGLLRAGADVAVMRPETVHPSVSALIDRLCEGVRLVEPSRVGRPAVFHRPFQVRSLAELAGCLSVGERLVLTHQDMILDRTRAYTKSDDAWHDYRATTTAALASADEVGFFSRHAALDAASEGMLELDRTTVVRLGVDHLDGVNVEEAGLARPLDGRPFVLVVGNSYWHKNRLFALRLVRHLVESHGWDGGLVLAGGHPGWGSSHAAEQALLAGEPAMRSRVVDLGHVSDSVQGALYRSAELVLFPSLYEGFGLIPFEAAAAGTACVYAHRASMQELLPPVGALPSFDLAEAGAFVHGLLEDAVARAHVVAAIRDTARTLTWDQTAAGYLEVYARALAREERGMSRLLAPLAERSGGVTAKELLVLEVYRRRRGFRLAVDGMIRTGSIGLRAARRLRGGKGPPG